MIVQFGLDFDGMLPFRPESRIGFVTAGPQQLLSILETQLGLLPTSFSGGTRIVQYRACLKEADNPGRFYHRSFEADELGVARTLLGWRDRWHEVGWEGTFSGSAGKRLEDLAEVERIARERVAPSAGERLANVKKALSSRRTQIERIELADDFADLPHMWQEVLNQFQVVEMGVDRRPIPGKKGTDLRKVQQVLCMEGRDRGTRAVKVRMSGDGSVVVLRAASRSITARLIAEYLQRNRSRQVSIVAGGHGRMLDAAFESVDDPLCGFQHLSILRPPMQILPLALGLLWKPLDPSILAEFLNLPMGPIRRDVRARLAQVVVEYPGIGGREWNHTVQSILKDADEAGSNREAVEKLAAEINYWLSCPRFEPDKGAPTATVAERCRKVADYLASRTGTAKEEDTQLLYASSHRQAADLTEAVGALREQGEERITRHQLERLLDFVSGLGGPLAGIRREVGHVPAAESPAVVTEAVEEVIWWDLSAPDLPTSYPWTASEIESLQRSGVRLPEIDRELTRLSKTWLRPIFSASRRLVIVIHECDEDHHPVWDRITACTEGWAEVFPEDFLYREDKVPHLAYSTAAMVHKRLPTPKRWWQIDSGRLLKRRDQESYSSLDAFIKSPYQWVLRHQAKLYPGRLAAPASGSRLKGNLVHQLIRDFFEAHPDWRKISDKELLSWIDARMPALLEQEGAVLLMPGMAVAREEFEETSRRAMVSLLSHLRSARTVNVKVEHQEKSAFIGGEIEGRIDLLLTGEDGGETVVDVKWGGLSYRTQELKANTHLQLAAYAYIHMREMKLSAFPAVGYFIIDSARLLAPEASVFPNAAVYPPNSGETVSHLWERLLSTWRWRRVQMDQGLIEVTVTGAEPTDQSTPPADGLLLEPYNDNFNDYAVLAGWTEDA